MSFVFSANSSLEVILEVESAENNLQVTDDDENGEKKVNAEEVHYRESQEALLTNYFSFVLYVSSMILPGTFAHTFFYEHQSHQ